jgi:hypothetical protein
MIRNTPHERGNTTSVKTKYGWGEYQRRTLTGTGRRKKTVQGSTGKNPRNDATILVTTAMIMVGFFCISGIECSVKKNLLYKESNFLEDL